MTMQKFAIGAALVFALTATMPAQALTPTQSTAAATKAKADVLARTKARALAKANVDAATRARVEAAAKTKVKFQTLLNVRAETKRREEAATKAAEANAKATSFQATSSPTTPHKLAHVPGKVAVGMQHPNEDPDRHRGATTGHQATAGHGH
jgi:hypothetical protein